MQTDCVRVGANWPQTDCGLTADWRRTDCVRVGARLAADGLWVCGGLADWPPLRQNGTI